ncbi:MAG: ABC transporter permease [Lachnospira sp.]|nr:ABC transporter permease [Lachnospira sp.]
MSTVKIICIKELTRIFKDKKMIFSMFILPIIILIGVYALMFMMISNAEKEVEEHQSIVFMINAPKEFVAITETLNDSVTLLENKDKLETYKEDIKEGNVDLIIEFPDNFAEGINKADGSVIPDVYTYYNPSEDYSSSARAKYTALLEQYRQVLLTERITDLNKITIFTVDMKNEQSQLYYSEKATGKMLGAIIPYMVSILLFSTAMSLGVDVFTGEKERGTMTALLITPVRRVNIATGKIVALIILSIISAAIYVITMVVGFPVLVKNMLGDGDASAFEGLAINFTVEQFLQITALVIGMVFLYVAMVALVAVFAKTIKEANSYVLPLYFIVIFGGITTMYGSAKTGIVQYLIPICNGPTALKAIFEQTITGGQLAATLVSIYLLAIIITFIIGKMFANEKIMQNS